MLCSTKQVTVLHRLQLNVEFHFDPYIPRGNVACHLKYNFTLFILWSHDLFSVAILISVEFYSIQRAGSKSLMWKGGGSYVEGKRGMISTGSPLPDSTLHLILLCRNQPSGVAFKGSIDDAVLRRSLSLKTEIQCI